ncbi:hypothetical protein CL633_00545 [bacterium]|nr:hypothetical protein [bacterium]|tara:strand:- start:19270 stop:20466 length:1197 start_codon:yes stop_codon:yes gene_type:complete
MSIILQKQLKKLPRKPGVYFFLDKKSKLLYIGKAGSLKTRVSSYFSKNINTRLFSMLDKAVKIEYQITDSVLEALILEANLIKKYQPKYNIREKDDKSFNYIVITREDWPRVLQVRGTDLDALLNAKIFGPYTSGKNLKNALIILRKIFPFRDKCKPGKGKKCFNAQINLCPGVCFGEITKSEYKKIISQLKMFLSGKKKRLISSIKKQMQEFAKLQKYELAAQLRNRLYALEHIHDIALLDSNIVRHDKDYNFYPRIEAYDISNISGKFAVGSMVVFENNEISKNEYRKFKIKTVKKANDIAMLKEILQRRLRHKEWKYPDLIIIDGGRGQLNGILKVLRSCKIKIPVVAIAKYGKDHLFKSDKSIKIKKQLIQQLRNEAHRFAIKYHRVIQNAHLV